MTLRRILVALLVLELFVLYDSAFGLPDPLTPVWERVRERVRWRICWHARLGPGEALMHFQP